MEAEIAADRAGCSRCPAGRTAGGAAACSAFRQRRRPHLHRHAWSVPSRSTYSTPIASPSSITTRSTRASARSSSRPAAQASWMYVLSVDLPAFVGQPCRHEPQLMQFASVYELHRLELGAPSASEARLDRAHALRASRCARARRAAARRARSAGRDRTRRTAHPRADEPLPRATSRSPSRARASATFVLIVVVPPTQRPPISADRAAGTAVDQREPDRPPEVVGCLRLPAREVSGGPVRAELEQQHAPALARRARPRRRRHPRRSRRRRRRSARSSDPQVRPVLRQPRGEGRVEVDLRPGARARRRRARRSRCRTPRSRAPAPAGTPAFPACSADLAVGHETRTRRAPPPAAPRPSAASSAST